MTDSISPKKQEDLMRCLRERGVAEADLIEEFIRGSGRGGQKVNKTNSCVQLFYPRKGWVIRCQKTRSREQNRFFARRILLARLDNEILGEQSKEATMRRRIRAQKKKRNKRAKEKILSAKRHRAETKQLRKQPLPH